MTATGGREGARWVNPLALARSEARRITVGRLPKIAVIALLLVPMLYVGGYLYANHDPYGRMDQVPAAIVNNDEGASLSTGEDVDLGPQIADDLLSSGSFDWHEVSESEARAGVDDGTFAFALIVPATFSADVTSVADLDPRQAHLVLVTNDANNYLSRTIAGQLVTQVTDSVAAQVSTTAASTMLEGFAEIRTSVEKARKGAKDLASGVHDLADGAGELADGAGDLVAGERRLVNGTASLSDGAHQIADGAADLADGGAALADGLGDLDASVQPLPAKTRKLADGAKKVADGNEEAAAKGRAAAQVGRELVDRMDAARDDIEARLQAAGVPQEQIDQVLARLDELAQPVRDANQDLQDASDSLDQLADGADQVADGTDELADGMPRLAAGVHSAHTGAVAVEEGASDLAAGASDLADGADTLDDGQQDALAGARALRTGARALDSGARKAARGADALVDGLTDGAKQIPATTADQRKAMAQTLGSPVSVDSDSLSTAGDYGGGLAPFFLSLATWIGGFVLFLLIRPLSNRALARGASAVSAALGGWITPAVMGAIQVAIAFAVTALVLGIRTVHPWWSLLVLVALAVTFAAIVQALTAAFGAVGKYLGLVFLVLQLISAGGTFPWQTLPAPLQVLHHILPMGYAVDALRHLMYGGWSGSLPTDLAVLAAYLVGALVVTMFAARRDRRWNVRRLEPELVL